MFFLNLLTKMNSSVIEYARDRTVSFFHDPFPRNGYSVLSLAYLSSDFRHACLLVNFLCPVPFSLCTTETTWLKTVHVHTTELPGTMTTYRLPFGNGPWFMSGNFGDSGSWLVLKPCWEPFKTFNREDSVAFLCSISCYTYSLDGF